MADRYRRTALLAQGGMAELYAGVAYGEEGFRRPVAIKRILPDLAQNEDVARMFLEEARLSMRLLHQNIVQVLDVGRADDGLYLVMELVNGWDLDTVLDAADQAQQRLPAALVAYAAVQILSGLSFAYRLAPQGGKRLTAHRDISASNVLLSAEGEVKVADFGIALVSEGPRDGPDPMGFTGKYGYAAPEVINGAAATVHSDQFSLGVLLYRMLAGRHPFGALAPLPEYVHRLEREAPPLVLGLPPLLQETLGRMLAKNPRNRFPTTEGCAQALNASLAETGQHPTAADLATFLKALPLPPPAFERAQLGSAPERPEESAGTGLGGAFELTSDWEPMGPTLGADGKLAARFGTPGQPPPPPAGPPPPPPEERLELSRPAPRVVSERVEVFRDVPPEKPRSRVVPVLALLVALALIGTAVWALLVRGGSTSLGSLTRRGTAVLYIDSEPEGAQVSLAGQPVGTTPLVLDNTYPDGDVSVEMTRKGYQPWKGTFSGGQPARMDITLRRLGRK